MVDCRHMPRVRVFGLIAFAALALGTVAVQAQSVPSDSDQSPIPQAQPDPVQPAQEQPSPAADPPNPGAITAQSPSEDSSAQNQPPGGKRVFGVLPNYRTADIQAVYMPITSKQKLTIASKDSFDYPLVLLAAAFAGLGQLTDQNPDFGQGMKGFSKRWGAAYADQALGNMMTEGFMPILLHEDPRYFRLGPGHSPWYRTGYALSRIFVTRTDSGGSRFNFSEWVGNATGVAISNAYYPDQRDALDNATKLLEQCGTDAVSQVLKEFWPDIKRKWFHKHDATDQQ